MSSPLVGGTSINAVIFGTYGNMQKLLGDTKENPLSLERTLLAGAVAGIAGAIATSPFDLVKTQLQTDLEVKRGVFQSIRDLVRHRGVIQGLGQGFGSTLLRDVPRFAVNFGLYEYIKRMMNTSESVKQLVAGAIAGTLKEIVIYPLDAIKSRMQAQKPWEPGGLKYNGIRDCAIKTYQENGIRTFYRGVGLVTVIGIPINAIMFYTYETIKHFLG
eukprot:TRINITY_DN1109_c0_g1_i2.p1 TRINITY_DN1109_c0_g1~~TRINITY_DN1109_c0_g1_i2.p1  ORF type:complete len:216 (-),score=28.15 TRINITY_DN1109_c0_g1_i2:66-713(-)